ncbi:HDOD domain-containing protein [Alteromonas sp. KS69]|jgi:HD-like signal output (HDOD) protein|uniref:Signal transduction protein n=1 Tax=Alteromonas naphthalenivorans TaxID=715451 RepID=F5Z952_ALTNA|nr:MULTISPECIES: HDOD domain-containing protein [Alteromonas]AEF03595.1 putative signal transduction protein [Alteromonas naphthalenivorans]MBO7921716.1 HDOD domain-containing protein [Alteromonas sp. K632G]PHS58587.1 MAG: HDOD domain-containing protein [Alteromonas sp.]RUP76078.1 HDOD domain-containing protein [Alteromonas sp. KS69]|tara:strand:+ start:1811 stop:2656 length:846 start_codon:yes stop_codon:yes gene_type:complete
MTLQDIISNASTLFVLPDSVTRLKACMDDGASNIDDIADIISFDPSLATQLLRVANSALYRFPNKIDTITKALQVVGTRSTYDLALAFGVSQAFKEIDGQVIDLDKFWEQSVSCGLLAKYFAEMRNIREPERLFVAGLLHNIGELVVVDMLPDSAKRCQAFNARVSPAELQAGVLGYTFTNVSAGIIKEWGIPETIYKPIANIHGDKNTTSDVEEQILQLSYVLALDNVNSEIYPSYNNLKPELHESLSLNRDDLEDALDITNLQCISVISLFNPNAFMLY